MRWSSIFTTGRTVHHRLEVVRAVDIYSMEATTILDSSLLNSWRILLLVLLRYKFDLSRSIIVRLIPRLVGRMKGGGFSLTIDSGEICLHKLHAVVEYSLKVHCLQSFYFNVFSCCQNVFPFSNHYDHPVDFLSAPTCSNLAPRHGFGDQHCTTFHMSLRHTISSPICSFLCRRKLWWMLNRDQLANFYRSNMFSIKITFPVYVTQHFT